MVPQSAEIVDNTLAQTSPTLVPAPLVKLAKDAIRRSLKASTADGIFAAVYSNVTAGVLLTNFVMDLGGSPTQIGLLASIPLVANLLQPLGAYLSEQCTSRHWYCLGFYIPSRLVWSLLILGLGLLHWNYIEPQTLIAGALAIAFMSFCSGALGSAAWLSWMAVLVPKRLRGRYFGPRNSAANLTNLISVPLMGMVISRWPSGPVDGFGIVLLLAIALLKLQDVGSNRAIQVSQA